MQNTVDSDELDFQRIKKHQSSFQDCRIVSYKVQINSKSGEYAESVNPTQIILTSARWLGWFKKKPVSWGSS